MEKIFFELRLTGKKEYQDNLIAYAKELLETLPPYGQMNQDDLLDNQVLDRYWELNHIDKNLSLEKIQLKDRDFYLVKDDKERIFGMIPPEYTGLMEKNKDNFTARLTGGNYRIVDNIPNTCKHIVETHYRDYGMEIIIGG